MIRNNEQKKMSHTKYNNNIYSCQVPETFKTHEYTSFFTYNPLEIVLQTKTVFMNLSLHITIQI